MHYNPQFLDNLHILNVQCPKSWFRCIIVG
ncbi:hypothetical protein HHE014_00920 [Helicobacter heilmannii]|nr:hypothetical protein HHE014_00920 [Helicobacter heilmannii]